MASTSPKHPDRAFRAAAIVLGGFAAIQVAAVFLAVAPDIKLDRVLAARAVPEVPAASAPVAASPDARTAPVSNLPSAEMVDRANQLLAQAEGLRSQGNLAGALAALAEADRIIANEPGILFQMAVVYYEMGRITDSRATANRALAIPSLRADPNYADVYQQLNLLLSQLGAPTPGLSSTGEPLPGSTPFVPEALPDPTSAAAELPLTLESGASGTGMLRDDSGIPIGSDFGIVECKISEAEDGVRKLRVATKGVSGQEVSASDFKVAVYFYEQSENGDIVETASAIQSEWLSPPMDWKDGEPELLEVRYPLPFADGESGATDYYGYVVGIYHKGELQDSRAEPVALLKQYPLKLTVTESAE